jgi:hypothetical protein
VLSDPPRLTAPRSGGLGGGSDEAAGPTNERAGPHLVGRFLGLELLFELFFELLFELRLEDDGGAERLDDLRGGGQSARGADHRGDGDEHVLDVLERHVDVDRRAHVEQVGRSGGVDRDEGSQAHEDQGVPVEVGPLQRDCSDVGDRVEDGGVTSGHV